MIHPQTTQAVFMCFREQIKPGIGEDIKKRQELNSTGSTRQLARYELNIKLCVP
jgi:hypothetical protein